MADNTQITADDVGLQRYAIASSRRQFVLHHCIGMVRQDCAGRDFDTDRGVVDGLARRARQRKINATK